MPQSGEGSWLPSAPPPMPDIRYSLEPAGQRGNNFQSIMGFLLQQEGSYDRWVIKNNIKHVWQEKASRFCRRMDQDWQLCAQASQGMASFGQFIDGRWRLLRCKSEFDSMVLNSSAF